MVGGAAQAARVSVHQAVLARPYRRASAALVLCTGTWTCAAAAEPQAIQPLVDLLSEPRWFGVLTIAVALFPLLLGWWLIRWSTALTTAGMVGATVLFMLHGRLAVEWTWTAVLCCAALAGVLGWFLYPLLFALQMAVIAGGMTYGALKTALPTLPSVAVISAVVVALIAGLIGLRLAPWAAIAQTVFIGFAGVLMGMAVLCRPQGTGEQLVLAILVGLITIPLGAWVQARAHRRAQQP